MERRRRSETQTLQEAQETAEELAAGIALGAVNFVEVKALQLALRVYWQRTLDPFSQVSLLWTAAKQASALSERVIERKTRRYGFAHQNADQFRD